MLARPMLMGHGMDNERDAQGRPICPHCMRPIERQDETARQGQTIVHNGCPQRRGAR
jgi:hypothetical protein